MPTDVLRAAPGAGAGCGRGRRPSEGGGRQRRTAARIVARISRASALGSTCKCQKPSISMPPLANCRPEPEVTTAARVIRFTSAFRASTSLCRTKQQPEDFSKVPYSLSLRAKTKAS